MARRSGYWAEIQRERARNQRLANQQALAAAKTVAARQREAEKRRREAARQAAADDRERKRLHVEEQRSKAAGLTADVTHRVSVLRTVLSAGVAAATPMTFESLKRAPEQIPFISAGLDEEAAAPDWNEFAPPAPGLVTRTFRRRRLQHAQAAAREAFEQQCAEHAATEVARKNSLELRQREHAERVAAAILAANGHNAQIDKLERSFRAADPDAIVGFFTLVLDNVRLPDGCPNLARVMYRSQTRDLLIDFELPPLELIPAERSFKYVQTRDTIDTQARPPKDTRLLYADLIAQITLLVLHEVFSVPDAADVVSGAVFNGRVSAIDKATGRDIRPHLISVDANREDWSSLVLENLDPRSCLRHLNALVSPHPYDLEGVRPVVDFEALLAQYNFVDGMDAIASLDGRQDLLTMSPTEFEHLSRQLFEAIGMDSWVTQASKDDGVDGVVTNPDPIMGGLCIVQAKRYSRAVGVEAVRELAGVMADKHATKGILVTTSWVTKAGHDFARRNGRIQIIEGDHLKYLCLEHLGRDVLISLPRQPPRRNESAR